MSCVASAAFAPSSRDTKLHAFELRFKTKNNRNKKVATANKFMLKQAFMKIIEIKKKKIYEPNQIRKMQM
jgi:hypothetical protein